MSDIFSRFDLTGNQFTFAMYFCIAVIWLMVVGCAISSIWSQRMSLRVRAGWMAAVILLPLVGLAAYLPFACRQRGDAGLFALFSKHLVRRGN